MEPITKFTARLAPLPINDIDTDQIIPARYLKTTDKEGLGQACFFDWRWNEDGTPKADFILNEERYKEAGVLVAGNNFGCGSSREHAPWALMGMGFKAVISTYFADIFKGNSLKNGLLPIVVDEETKQQLISIAQEDPTATITIDLETQTVTLPDNRKVSFPVDSFSRYCLLNGVDQLGFLQSLESETDAYEAANPQRVYTTVVA